MARPAGGWATHLALGLAALATVLPLLLMLANAFTPNDRVTADPIRLLPADPTLANFREAAARYPIWTWLANSILTAGLIMLGKLLLSVPAAFAFARLRFPGRDAAFAAVVGTLSFPSAIAILPTYIAAMKLDLTDTRAGFLLPMIPYVGFYVFYLRQAFRALPPAMFDAAALDGAGPLRQLVLIALPNVRPALALVAVLSFTGAWNIYLWAQMLLERVPLKTLVAGIALFADLEARERLWGPVMACAVLSVAPVLALFLAAQRYVAQGFAPAGVER